MKDTAAHLPMNERGMLVRFAWLSVGAADTTIALKSVAYWVTDSVGLLSDALESLVNLAAALLAVWLLGVAAQPPDEEHHFGHSKAEYFAGGIEGALILLAAATIAITAVERLFMPIPLTAVGIGLTISAIATVVNLVVGRILIAAGRRHHSMTLEADGQHLMTDVWTSVAVIAAVLAVGATGWLWLDPVIALAVAANIAWTGWGLTHSAIAGLMDRALAPEERTALHAVLAEYERQGIAFHALRTRQAGARRFVSFHVLVPEAWSVGRGHELLEEIEAKVRAVVPHASVFTHIEPIEQPSAYDDEDLDR